MTETREAFDRTAWIENCAMEGTRVLAEETAVAISYNGSTHAVLMATPADLDDLAVGFSVTEGIVDSPSAIEAISVVEFEQGIDVQVRVRDDIAERLAQRRRSMAGPVGCGMCGLESLAAATRALDPVRVSTTITARDITSAVKSIELHQSLNRETKSVHAAGFFVPGSPVTLVREDVGRHNALDKLIGALLRSQVRPSTGGFVVTSRVSVELVQKSAVVGCGLLAAISAPTALAVRTARDADVTLAAIVRGQSFEVFSRPDRIVSGAIADVA